MFIYFCASCLREGHETDVRVVQVGGVRDRRQGRAGALRIISANARPSFPGRRVLLALVTVTNVFCLNVGHVTFDDEDEDEAVCFAVPNGTA